MARIYRGPVFGADPHRQIRSTRLWFTDQPAACSSAVNRVDLLSTTSAVIQSFAGSLFGGSTDGNQRLPFNNRPVIMMRAIGDAAIGGMRFASTGNSAEVDNVVFAVPEPAT